MNCLLIVFVGECVFCYIDEWLFAVFLGCFIWFFGCNRSVIFFVLIKQDAAKKVLRQWIFL